MEFTVSALFLIGAVPENIGMESEEVSEEEKGAAMSGSVDDGSLGNAHARPNTTNPALAAVA
jgi:hypothetical protein